MSGECLTHKQIFALPVGAECFVPGNTENGVRFKIVGQGCSYDQNDAREIAHSMNMAQARYLREEMAKETPGRYRDLTQELYYPEGQPESKGVPPMRKRVREEVVDAEEAAQPVVGAASEIPLTEAEDAMEM